MLKGCDEKQFTISSINFNFFIILIIMSKISLTNSSMSKIFL